MTTPPFTHFVFVDFENVPEIDLGLIEGRQVQVTLMIGGNQGKLDFALVDQIHRLASQVSLVKLGVSGRNALDLTLSYYLGQAVLRGDAAEYCIVSRDKDFDPLLGHLTEKGLKVWRCESFSDLPCVQKTVKRAPQKVAAPNKTVAPQAQTPVRSLKEEEAEARYQHLLERLKNNLAPRPKKKEALLAHINTAFGGKLSEAEVAQKLEDLLKRGVLFIDAKERVTYAARR